MPGSTSPASRPRAEDLPVFEHYALQEQYDAIRLVGERTDVPVPQVRWIEPTGDGAGHAVLPDGPRRRASCRRDVLPYNFGDNWLFDATAGAPARGCRTRRCGSWPTLHAIPDATDTFGFLDPPGDGATALARNLARTRAWYEFAVPDIGRSPITERGPGLARGPPPDDGRGGPVLGRRAHRQRALPRLRAGRRPRLGDGDASGRARWTCPGWCSPTRSSSRSPACWDARHAALPARGGRRRDVRGAHRRPLGAARLVPRLQRRRSGASSSCAPAPGRSTSARSSGPTTSRR